MTDHDPVQTGVAGSPRSATKRGTAWRAARVAVVVVLVAGAVWYQQTRPLSGTVERRLMVGGVTRTYLLYTGQHTGQHTGGQHTGGQPRPGRALVLVLHGLGGSGASIERRTNGTFDRLAEQDGAVVVYPNALGDPRRWNDGWWNLPGVSETDDVGFLAAVIDGLVAQLGVDRKRVFAAGMSNGAAMVHRLACERPDLVAAVAPVAGGMASSVAGACAPGPPLSVIEMHGTADPTVPFDRSIHDSVAGWIKREGCPAQPISTPLPDTDPADGTRTRVDEFRPCTADTEVALYTIEGGRHAWPGGASWRRRPGNPPRDFDAGVLIWDFFRRHPRR